jgi:hypothetical protein
MSNEGSPRGPTSQQRTLVLGRTGSGKSQFAIALLSNQNWHEMPWVIVDYKGEDLIIEIMEANPGKIKNIKVTDSPPTKPGLYYMRPIPKVDDEAMEAFLWKVWKRGYCGLFFDEGYCVPDKAAFDVIMTQGRTLHIPVICLYQRPAWMSRFAVAQSDFRAVFSLDDERDEKTASMFVKPAITETGDEITVKTELPPYWCLWYDVGLGKSTVLRPAPDKRTILGNFRRRLGPSRKQRAIV